MPSSSVDLPGVLVYCHNDANKALRYAYHVIGCFELNTPVADWMDVKKTCDDQSLLRNPFEKKNATYTLLSTRDDDHDGQQPQQQQTDATKTSDSPSMSIKKQPKHPKHTKKKQSSGVVGASSASADYKRVSHLLSSRGSLLVDLGNQAQANMESTLQVIKSYTVQTSALSSIATIESQSHDDHFQSSSQPNTKSKRRGIILHLICRLCREDQAALRRIIEKHTNTSFFVVTSTHISDIDKAVQSRMIILRLPGMMSRLPPVFQTNSKLHASFNNMMNLALSTLLPLSSPQSSSQSSSLKEQRELRSAQVQASRNKRLFTLAFKNLICDTAVHMSSASVLTAISATMATTTTSVVADISGCGVGGACNNSVSQSQTMTEMTTGTKDRVNCTFAQKKAMVTCVIRTMIEWWILFHDEYMTTTSPSKIHETAKWDGVEALTRIEVDMHRMYLAQNEITQPSDSMILRWVFGELVSCLK